ncbi:hypothetical protein PVT68_01345 [Microbulbifer bruguierae]|uniref:Uncharacterized protein n=1 Tax=Microbulbifer bruguierae TaxID=3029061 RepID=A0ABY8NDG7_9GAMM|nr:hypothetical protein [Microbulbifer bruguierae]WGL16958.1 hypothetical protein PVT68_01345 [Microbulbifer bruguierae]
MKPNKFNLANIFLYFLIAAYSLPCFSITENMVQKDTNQQGENIETPPLTINLSAIDSEAGAAGTMRLNLLSSTGAYLDNSSKWPVKYNAFIDLSSGIDTENPEEAAQEFLLNGGDGGYGLEISLGRKIETSDGPASIFFDQIRGFISYQRNWLNVDLDFESNTRQVIDDQVQRYAGGFILDKDNFHIIFEWSKSDYQGPNAGAFSEILEGKTPLRISWLRKYEISETSNFTVRIDTLTSKEGDISQITLSKPISL